MNRLAFWTLLLLVCSASGCAPEAPEASHAAEDRPNVILVITDDQGYGDLAAHGNPMIQTPNLDRLRAESIRLTDFHVDPTCSPTRAALMTGRYSTRTGVWHTIRGRSLMHPDEVTLAEVFAEAGYRTGMVGADAAPISWKTASIPTEEPNRNTIFAESSARSICR